MNKIKFFFNCCIFFTLISCFDRNISNEKELEDCKRDVMLNSDLTSYSKLLNYFDKENNYYERLPYILKIAEIEKGFNDDFFVTYLKIKFDNKFDKNNIEKLKKPEKDFLIYLLVEGALNGDDGCKDFLIYYYKNGIVVEKNIEKADSIIISKNWSYKHIKNLLSNKIDSANYERNRQNKFLKQ